MGRVAAVKATQAPSLLTRGAWWWLPWHENSARLTMVAPAASVFTCVTASGADTVMAAA